MLNAVGTTVTGTGSLGLRWIGLVATGKALEVRLLVRTAAASLGGAQEVTI